MIATHVALGSSNFFSSLICFKSLKVLCLEFIDMFHKLLDWE